MTEKIAPLIESERVALAQYFWDTTDIEYMERADGFVDLLNKLREPIPLGTVRADEDGSVAVKVFNHVSDQWYVHRGHRCSSRESDEYVADWPIVYRPTE